MKRGSGTPSPAHLPRLYGQVPLAHNPRTVRPVRKNVARFAKPPKYDHVERPVMSVADAMLLLEDIRGHCLKALYLLAVPTGLRRGEMLGLKWPDLES